MIRKAVTLRAGQRIAMCTQRRLNTAAHPFMNGVQYLLRGGRSMAGKRETKREDLRARLLTAATARIEKAGVKGLRARDVTADAGCALGALYTAFHDLDELVIHINSRTLSKLGEALADASHAIGDPGDKLKCLAIAYVAFARENRNLWAALFDHRFPPTASVPQWHMAEQDALVRLIAAPLADLRPGLGEGELAVWSRTFFAAVHGIVSISLEDRFIGIPSGNLETELRRFVDILVAGAKAW
jgi:AcrR family transcriptional regulator